ncbi:hypothetical protein F2P56_011853, partial [Juglans regia]
CSCRPLSRRISTYTQLVGCGSCLRSFSQNILCELRKLHAVELSSLPLILKGGRGGHYDRKHCLRVYSLGYHSLLQHIFDHVMAAIGGNSASPGILVSRAATLGPSQPNPVLNLAVVGLKSQDLYMGA